MRGLARQAAWQDPLLAVPLFLLERLAQRPDAHLPSRPHVVCLSGNLFYTTGMIEAIVRGFKQPTVLRPFGPFRLGRRHAERGDH